MFSGRAVSDGPAFDPGTMLKITLNVGVLHKN